MGKRLIITEEEKKHIMSLYEQPVGEQPSNEPTDNPKSIDVKKCLLDNGYTDVIGTQHYWRMEKPGADGNMVSVYTPKNYYDDSFLKFVHVQKFVEKIGLNKNNGKYFDKGKIEIKDMECSNIISEIDRLYSVSSRNENLEVNCRGEVESLLNRKGFQYDRGNDTYFLKRTGFNKNYAGTKIVIKFDKPNKGELQFEFYDDGGILDKANKIMNSLGIKNEVVDGEYVKSFVYFKEDYIKNSDCRKSEAYIFLSKLPQNL